MNESKRVVTSELGTVPKNGLAIFNRTRTGILGYIAVGSVAFAVLSSGIAVVTGFPAAAVLTGGLILREGYLGFPKNIQLSELEHREERAQLTTETLQPYFDKEQQEALTTNYKRLKPYSEKQQQKTLRGAEN
jgi:hypothetical protein